MVTQAPVNETGSLHLHPLQAGVNLTLRGCQERWKLAQRCYHTLDRALR